MSRGITATLALVAVGLLWAGCGVTVGRSGEEERPVWVRDNKVTLDFTVRPTREAFGFGEHDHFNAADRHGPLIEVTIKLPDGSIRVPAFGITAATNMAGGADDVVFTHVPKSFNVLVRYPDAKAAFEALSEQAPVLGISRERLEEFRPDFGAGAVVPQQGVLPGLIKDWLDLEVVVRDGDNGTVQVIYQISVDVFHNEAVDKVLHGNRFHLDLTRKPTREALGFLPTYSDANIEPEPGSVINAVVDTERGRLSILTDSVLSGSGDPDVLNPDPQGVLPPGSTTFLGVGDAPQIERELVANAQVLGIAPATVTRLLDPRSPRVQDKVIATVDTSVFHLDVSLSTFGEDEDDEFTAELDYDFTF